MRDAFIKCLCEIAQKDKRIMLVTGDLGFGVLNEYRERFPDQFINAGVAEQNMTGLATGLAMEGYIVWTYSIGNFPTLRCLEQIRNDACYHHANVKVVSIGGGFSYGPLGISHHATEDLAIMRSLPDMTVVSPGGLWEATEATKAIYEKSGTCFLRLDKAAGEDGPRDGESFHLGEARVIRNGNDCTIIVTGGILEEAQKAADILVGEGVDVRIISMHTIKPFDREKVCLAAKETKGIVVLEEHTIEGGLGGAVAEALCDSGIYPGFFKRVALEKGFSCIVGSQLYLREQYGLDAASVVACVRQALAE